MKKTYTKKQITEAIAYWKKQLKKMNESSTDSGKDFEKQVGLALVKNIINQRPDAYVQFVDASTQMLKGMQNPDKLDSVLTNICSGHCTQNSVNVEDCNGIILVIRTGNKITTTDICIAEFDTSMKLVDTTWIECKKDISFANLWTPTFKISYDSGKYLLQLNNAYLQRRAPSAYTYLNDYFNKIFRDRQFHSDPVAFSDFLKSLSTMSNSIMKSDELTITSGFGKFLDAYFKSNENEYARYNVDYMIVGSGVRNGSIRESACLQLNPNKNTLVSTNGQPFATDFQDIFRNGLKIQLRQRNRNNRYVEIDCDIMAKVLPDIGTIF